MLFRFQAGLTAILTALGFSGNVALAEPAVPPFYQAVMQMKVEGKLGQVIKQEKIKTSIKGAQAWRIAYISSDLTNKKTISTGLVVAPIGQAPVEGRPVMSWSHGTTGNAQSCGPSQVENPAQELNEYFLIGGNSWTDYGLPNVEQFIKEGYVVVGTDYQGLGGGGRHQYAVSNTNARDAINIIRAAGTMKETGAGKKAVIYGWSQGAGATIAAAGQPSYIAQKETAHDGIDVVGFVAMAPNYLAMYQPAKLDQASGDKMISDFAAAWSGNVFEFAHFAQNMWGTQAAFPDKLKLSDLFTDEGAKALDEIYSNKCVHAGVDTVNYAYGSSYKTLLRPQLKNSFAWAQAIVDGAVNVKVKPVAPVLVLWGNKDTAMPPVMGDFYRKKVCEIGGNVARVQLPGDQTHFSTPRASVPFYMPWIKARLAGKTAANGCSAENVM